MPDRDREFLEYYERQRVEDQLEYYRRKSEWHGSRDDILIAATGILMFVASGSAALVAFGGGNLGPPLIWTAIAAVAPALSAAIAATRALNEHQRNHERYENTHLDLEYLRAYRAPSSSASPDDYRAALVEYVTEVENLLSQENRQWVQMMEAIQQAQPPEASNQFEGG